MAGKKRDENAVTRKANISVMLTADEKAEFVKAQMKASGELGVDLGGAGMGRVALRWFKQCVANKQWAEIAQYLDAETVLAQSTREELGLD